MINLTVAEARELVDHVVLSDRTSTKVRKTVEAIDAWASAEERRFFFSWDHNDHELILAALQDALSNIATDSPAFGFCGALMDKIGQAEDLHGPYSSNFDVIELAFIASELAAMDLDTTCLRSRIAEAVSPEETPEYGIAMSQPVASILLHSLPGDPTAQRIHEEIRTTFVPLGGGIVMVTLDYDDWRYVQGALKKCPRTAITEALIREIEKCLTGESES